MRPPLAGVRVIDASTRWGELAGRILAELGAEVYKVEPAGGTDSRRVGPFHDGESMYWASVGAGKRSVVAEDPVSMLDDADVFIESGRRDDFGSRFPRLVHVCVTPFGIDGPMAHAPAAEITVEAAGGLVNLQGNGDRAPVPMGAMPQAAFHAGAQAAADTVVALCERERSGLGQRLDVSAQACIVWTLMNATGFPPNTGRNPPGTSEFRGQPRPLLAPGLKLPNVVRCRDGYAQLGLQMPIIGERTFAALLRWAEASGAELPATLRDRDMGRWVDELRCGELTATDAQAAADAVVALLGGQSKREIQAFSARHGLMLAAIHTVDDLASDPHLEDRDFWICDGGRRHAGPFARLSRTPLSRDRRVQALGESAPPPPRPPPQQRVQARRGQAPAAPFEGLRVADFSWVGVGPMIGKALADHGATVVRVESGERLDLLRNSPPFRDGERHPDRAQFMANFNSSKLGITLDLKNEHGGRLARRLADWADVVLESFSPGTMARFGLDWETLSAERTDLIMLSTCMRGQTGRERSYSGFGGQGAAIAGLFDLVGWPDRSPSGPWGAYTDFITPRFGVAALAAALLHRGRTGEGQYIDLSQIECGIRFLEPLIVHHAVGGAVPRRLGQGSPQLEPHGVFACRGQQRYIAVGVETDAERKGLAETIGAPAHRGVALTEALAAWCEPRDAFEAAATLRGSGVPAHVVARPSDLYEDEQLAHRGFFVTLDHPVMGATPYDGPATRYSRTPPCLRSPAPCLGQHTEEVMAGILGLGAQEIEDARRAGAFGGRPTS